MQRTSQWNIFKGNTSIRLYIKMEVENNMMMGVLQSNPHQLGLIKGEMKTSPLLNQKRKRKQKTICNQHPSQNTKKPLLHPLVITSR